MALKRGMRQLLADAEAAESRHGTLIAVERQKRRDETANLQQAVHESDKHAQRIQESLAAKMKELEETQIKMDELHKLVSGQEKQMEKQKERMTQSHKLEAQLREFFHMQGGRSLEAWHKVTSRQDSNYHPADIPTAAVSGRNAVAYIPVLDCRRASRASLAPRCMTMS